ncbi:M16 family metallopeptidase [Bordetella avium]|uniref:Zinc protease n=2 Tax=Bordetella avium TaxID=521 RepID=Q2KWA6_BORA1|nr:insulinase family protein [Bordetella avium]AZY50048.1 insulinase family protein [Bordetella avium]AZY53413.1 insulinase family protein [Bordetella avium]RIQ12994.1 insulinase family protein [Bordetella avium]RIQ37556.1 insulinase family protein [Bordetella avium]RIQ42316.1 insulinase family protein [Bordetella avium]
MRLSLTGLTSRLSALLVTSFLSLQVGAAPMQGITEVTSIEGITEYKLQNGLRVLLVPDSSKPTTTVNMTYLVGSRNENYGQTGMAHLLEHMLFKGTATTRNALGEFSRRGLRANGSTSTDRTNYFASFASNPETLRWYLGWQADAMVNSLISKDDLDSEMTVVRNEMESGENNPFRVLMQKMQAAAYQWHNYGKSTIGARADVENVDVAQLRAFYHEYYQPDNAVLIVAGKFDPKTTLSDIEATLGKLPRPARELRREYTVEPVQDGERSVTLRRAGGTPLVAAMYHIPAAGSPDFIPMDLASVILSDTPSGRLYHALVPTKLASGVFGFTMDQRDPGIAMFGAQLQAGMDETKALDTLVSTLESLHEKPFTQEELDRARNKWLTSWQQTYSDPQKVGVALSEAIATGDWRLFFLQRDRVRMAKLPEVQRVAEDYLRKSNSVLGRYIPTDKPQRAPQDSRPDLSAVFKDYKGDPNFKAVEAFDPTPANIDKLTLRRTLTLPNGPVELALLPKATRGDRVEANLLVQFGDVESLRGQRTAISAVADLLERGTPTLSRQQISDRIDQLEADVSISGAGTDLAIDLSTTGKNLPALIELVMDVVRNANFPQDQVEEYKRQSITAIQSAMTEPTALASRALARHDNPWKPDDIRYVPTFDEALADIRSLNREALVRAHERFYGAGQIKVAVVGEFDPAAVEASLKKSLDGWKRAPAYTRIPTPFHAIKAEQFTIDTPDKANAFYISGMPLQLQDTNPDYVPLYLANFLLGTSETSRLWNRVRETDGLSYNVRSNLSVSSFEPSSSWTIYAIYAPENRARVETAIAEELARVLKQGFGDKEVSDGITALLNYRSLSRAQDGVLASNWLSFLSTGRSFAWSADVDKRLAALTAAEVNATLRKYLKPADFSTAVAGDFKKTAP